MARHDNRYGASGGSGLLLILLLAGAHNRLSAQVVVDHVMREDGTELQGVIYEGNTETAIRLEVDEGETLLLPLDALVSVTSDGSRTRDDPFGTYFVLNNNDFLYGEIVEEIPGGSVVTFRPGDLREPCAVSIGDTTIVTLHDGRLVRGVLLERNRLNHITLRTTPSFLMRKKPSDEIVNVAADDLREVRATRPPLTPRGVMRIDEPEIADTPPLPQEKRKGVGATLTGGWPAWVGLSMGADLGKGWGFNLSYSTDNPMIVAYLITLDTNALSGALDIATNLHSLDASIVVPIGQSWGWYLGGGISWHDDDAHFTFVGGWNWYFSDQIYLTGGIQSEPFGFRLGLGFSNVASILGLGQTSP